MKLGIAIFPADFAIRPDELARAVEERGFESLFFTDHTHIPATPQTRTLMQETQGGVQPHFTHNYDPFIAIACAAAATQTLRLGTGVCLIPEREPIATAKAVVSLDVLSHGRVLFGVGVGWIPEEIANHGIDPPTRWAVMDERVQAMRTIWTQDEAEYHGHHVDFGPIWSWPKPKQRPHPPILVGGAGKGVIRRVLAYGDEWMPHAGMPVEQLGARIRELQDTARSAGRDVDIPVTVQGAEPDARALNELREVGVTRATLYAPSADADQVLRFLDEAAPLIDATGQRRSAERAMLVQA
jgi:probable F420-dependent oxidoreductase